MRSSSRYPRSGSPLAVQVGALGQDALVEPAELRRGVDPELVGQDVACALEGRERLALAAGPVEREHQLLPEPLP